MAQARTQTPLTGVRRSQSRHLTRPLGKPVVSLRVIILCLVCWLVGFAGPAAVGQPIGISPEVQSLINKGIEQRRPGRYSDSMATLERALAMAKAAGDLDGEWSARAFLGLTIEDKGDLRRALTLREENLAFARKHRDVPDARPMDRERDSLGALSAVHTLMGDFERAVETLGPPPPLLRERPAATGR